MSDKKIKSSAVIPRRVYGYFLDKDNSIQYIGSSYCTLETLTYNHHHAFEKYPNDKRTSFRCALRGKINEGTFKTLLELECDLLTIEDIEGKMIRAFKPPYNIDMNPVKSSSFYERYSD